MWPVETATDDLLDFMTAVGALQRSLLAVAERTAAAAGLSPARAACLRQVEEGPRTVADIASRLDLTRQGVLRVADHLVDDGFATYADNPRHRRARLLTLTDTGRTALRRMATAHHDWVADTAPRLAPLRVAELTGRLHAVQAAMDTAADPPA